MEAKAILSKVRLIPRKARLTIDLIRDKNALEAISILNNTTNKSAKIIKKVLLSAMANAENNLELNREKLYVKEAYIDEGPTLKRMKPRAKGKSDEIKKRTSHVTIIVSEKN